MMIFFSHFIDDYNLLSDNVRLLSFALQKRISKSKGFLGSNLKRPNRNNIVLRINPSSSEYFVKVKNHWNLLSEWFSVFPIKLPGLPWTTWQIASIVLERRKGCCRCRGWELQDWCWAAGQGPRWSDRARTASLPSAKKRKQIA